MPVAEVVFCSAVREAELLSSLDHPNIVRFLGCFVAQDCLHIVTEIAQSSLEDVINQSIRDLEKRNRAVNTPRMAAALDEGGPFCDSGLGEERIWKYTLQLCLGLDYLHAAGEQNPTLCASRNWCPDLRPAHAGTLNMPNAPAKCEV